MLDIYLMGVVVAWCIASVAMITEIRVGKKLNWLDCVLLTIFTVLSWVSVVWFVIEYILEVKR
jgi:hypothetical protein